MRTRVTRSLRTAVAVLVMGTAALFAQGPPSPGGRPAPGGQQGPGRGRPPGNGSGSRPTSRPSPGPRPGSDAGSRPRPTPGTRHQDRHRETRPGPSPGNRPGPSPGNRPVHRPGNRPPQWGRPPQNRPSYSFRPNDRAYLAPALSRAPGLHQSDAPPYLSHWRLLPFRRHLLPIFAAPGHLWIPAASAAGLSDGLL